MNNLKKKIKKYRNVYIQCTGNNDFYLVYELIPHLNWNFNEYSANSS